MTGHTLHTLLFLCVSKASGVGSSGLLVPCFQVAAPLKGHFWGYLESQVDIQLKAPPSPADNFVSTQFPFTPPMTLVVSLASTDPTLGAWSWGMLWEWRGK